MKTVVTGVNNVCIGENAGFDITTQSNQVRIGNFTESEVERGSFDDCLIADNGRVVIKLNVLDFLKIDVSMWNILKKQKNTIEC